MRLVAILPFLLLASAAQADVMPISSNEDGRIGVAHISGNETVRLQVNTGNDLTVLLPFGEHVQQVTVSDTNIWHVAVTTGQDALVLSALRPSGATGMTLRSDRRTYEFSLTAVPNGTVPYLVRLDPNTNVNRPRVWTPPVVVQPGTYKLSGHKDLYPSSIRDDGRKIYLQWSASQPIPAVFALNRQGREEMVDGYMREGTFTLDRLYDELVFRIDKAQAHARRIAGKGKP